MCDVKKYNQIFEDIKQLQPNDTLQLILEAKTKEERDFYEMIGNYLLQNEQRRVAGRNILQSRNNLVWEKYFEEYIQCEKKRLFY